jgi:hypothetical protein
MVLPFIAGAIASGIGSAALTAIGEAIAGSPTEAEARQRVAPLFNREVAKLMAAGLSYPDAEKQANESVSGHIQGEMAKSNLPEWASGALGVVGGIGGWAAGAKLASKGLSRMAGAKAASLADAAVEDPLKKAAAGAVAEGSGKAIEGAAKVGPFPKGKQPRLGMAEEIGEPAAMNNAAEEVAERGVMPFEHVPEVLRPFPKMMPQARIPMNQPMLGLE